MVLYIRSRRSVILGRKNTTANRISPPDRCGILPFFSGSHHPVQMPVQVCIDAIIHIIRVEAFFPLLWRANSRCLGSRWWLLLPVPQPTKNTWVAKSIWKKMEFRDAVASSFCTLCDPILVVPSETLYGRTLYYYWHIYGSEKKV
jgi:hypothetical protein